MKIIDNDLQFSISDIVQYFKSPFSSWATWANLQKPGYVYLKNDKEQNSSLLLRSEENEDDAKRYLINRYKEIKSITNPLDSESESKKLIMDKPEVIIQPTLLRDNFVGRADFLIYDSTQNLYEVMDAKLAKQVKAEFLLQVCGYTWMLENYQDGLPKYGSFFLGNEEIEDFKIKEFYRFFIDLKKEFLQAVDHYSLENSPVPRKWEVFEDFNEAAKLYWNENRSLELIADISSRQIDILEGNGYSKIDQIPKIIESNFSKLSSTSFDKLKRQANAQLLSTENETHVELKDGQESIHYLHTLLPEEKPGDIYFDLEGYPFYDIRSVYTMEYLYGVAYKNDAGELIFKDDLWADNEQEEKLIFSKFVEWVEERISRYPDLKIYHYAHYEKTSLLKSAQKFGIHEIEIDNWIRDQRLVDLYQVVRKSFIVGKDSYSIKRIEEIAGYKRELDLNSGIDSIYYFEKYLCTKDNKIKDEILLYNKDDCFATEVVCNWLRDKQKEYSYDFIQIEPELSQPSDEDILLKEIEVQINNLKGSKFSDEILEFMSTMAGYYRREEKVDWQEYFELLNMPLEDKINTPTAFGLLSLEGKPILKDKKYSLVYKCHDETFKKIKTNSKVKICYSHGENFEIHSLYSEVGSITTKPFTIEFLLSISAWEKLRSIASEDTSILENPTAFVNPVAGKNTWISPYRSLVSLCEEFIKNGELSPLVEKLILNKPNPEFLAKIKDENNSEKIYNFAKKLDSSYLAIQGPPGTGKSTYLGEVIAKLHNDGKKIGIVGPSYKATLNLVKKITPHLTKTQHVNFIGGGKELQNEIASLDKIKIIKSLNEADSRLIATYVNSISHANYRQYFDYIVIDEVGQVPLVTTIAVSESTQNLVLIGDPNQLPQVRNGSHPNGNGVSTLEHLIGESTTLPKDKGLFLNTTYRMHDDINSFISSYFYDDKLLSHSDTNLRYLKNEESYFKSTGIEFVSVPHKGNTQESQEEVEAVNKIINKLLNSTIVEQGKERNVVENDILVVSPYNLQVFEISKKLGNKFKVGTVDKFQGQEAPIVIVSLAASNYEEVPRGIDFILNFNRMNVALSRSQCLSIVVGSPDLTHLRHQSLNSIRLTNFHRTLMNSN